MLNPRNEAVRILTKIKKNSSYSVLTLSKSLKSSDFDDPRDVNFTVSLVYGVLEHKITLDYNISLYLKSGLGKLKDNVLNILRIGAFQILYTDRIPDSAAVNEAVKSSKKLNAGYASGLINAVLRRISENGIKLPDKNNITEYISVKYSISEDLTKYFLKDFGINKTKEIFESFNGRRPIFIRQNTILCNKKQLSDSLLADGVYIQTTDLNGCYCIDKTGNISDLEAYKKGFFHVQDKSSQLCCRLLGANEGDKIVDCCAAPGGKSFTIAEYMNNKGILYSCDIYEHKTSLIKEGAQRLKISNIKTICSDARALKSKIDSADAVICDVPCSGLGVLGRKPEIRYKTEKDLVDLPALQYEILSSCSEMVKQGGTLLYSTCTLNYRENDKVCDNFLSQHKDFRIADDEEYKTITDRYITILPDKSGGDGFFIAKFIRG